MERQGHSAPNITDGVIWKQLLAYFFPILFGTFFQQLYNTADAVIVGQFVGTAALAAVGGATGTIINIFVNIFVGISSGASVIVAQSYGANRQQDVHKAVHTAAALSLAGGGTLMLLGIFLAPWMLRAMGTPGDVMSFALSYIRIYFLGIIPSFFYNVGAGVLRAIGDTRRPLYFLVVACLTNIALDMLFVALLGIGVAGAALATILSQLVSAILVFASLTQTPRSYRLDPRAVRFAGDALRGILRVGLPAALQSNLYAIANLLIQGCINSFGTQTVAAWTAFGKVDGFFWMITGAYGIAVTTFSGQNFGARRYARVRQSVRVCAGMAAATSVLMSVLMCLFAGGLLRLFTSDTAVLELGSQMVYWMTPFYITYVMVEIFSGAIRGVGDSLVPMIITGTGICLLRIAWMVFVLPLNRSIYTLMVSYPVSWVVTSLIFLLYYLRGGWLQRSIVRAGHAAEPAASSEQIQTEKEALS